MKGQPPLLVAKVLVGLVLAAALYGSAFIAGGYALHPTRVKHVPGLCKGDQFNACLAQEVAAQAGGMVPSVKCGRIAGQKYTFYCDTGLAGSCYDVLAYRADQGFPIMQTVTQRETC